MTQHDINKRDIIAINNAIQGDEHFLTLDELKGLDAAMIAEFAAMDRETYRFIMGKTYHYRDCK